MEPDFEPHVLSQLAADLDVDSVREIIQSYLQEAPQLLAQARSAAAAKDLDGFRRAVHTLKSTSANMGALRLAEASKALESQARMGALPSSPAPVEELFRLFQGVRGRLESWKG